ncbi:MAG: cobalamin-dependent protein, partial [Lentisphaerota bacterium]
MPHRRRILFLQLPLLDNDVTAHAEEISLASVYLRHALQQNTERAFHRVGTLSARQLQQDDQRLIQSILARRPDILACTLYLWNIERTLHLIARLKTVLPHVKVLAGGPEVARNHPFLFKQRLVDVAVIGEGEAVFPLILSALRQKRRTCFVRVGWKTAKGYVWGQHPSPCLLLREALPPPTSRLLKPDRHGTAYLETSRGCPLRCTYCCYSLHSLRVSHLSAEEALARVSACKAAGAREIRIIDPTFNANPDFESIIQGLASINRDCTLKFFAELRADTLTCRQIYGLNAAGFPAIEGGV